MSLTPVIDVVFLLLLFFMLASTFTRFSHVDIELGGQSSTTETTENASNILLSVTGNGDFSVNGVPVSLVNLKEALRYAANGGKARILVRPSEQATAEQIIHAVEQAGAADIGSVLMVR